MSFSILQSDYLQLAPIGTFPHARGFQAVDAPALAELVKNFNSFLARLGRRFAGVLSTSAIPMSPATRIYTPTAKPTAGSWTSNSATTASMAGPNGAPPAHDLIANGHFKFLSPYWEATKIGMKDGKPVFRPTVLISVGLTNEPNLPVLPLANTNTDQAEPVPLLGSPLPLESDLNPSNSESETHTFVVPPLGGSQPATEIANQKPEIASAPSVVSTPPPGSIPTPITSETEQPRYVVPPLGGPPFQEISTKTPTHEPEISLPSSPSVSIRVHSWFSCSHVAVRASHLKWLFYDNTNIRNK